MSLFDLPLDELRAYRPASTAAPDFDDFWAETIATARTYDLGPVFAPVDNRLALIDSYDVSFAGFGGTPVRAWLHLPVGADRPLPTVVCYHGYSHGRSMPFSWTTFAAAGYAQLVVDTRGQGWADGGVAGTADAAAEGGEPHAPGFLTAGLSDPRRHYYRRVFTDAVRALEAAAAHPLVDPEALVVTGQSQGGGISIAAAGLAGEVSLSLRGCAPDVPFLAHIERAVALTDALPYGELTRYLAGWREQVPTAYRTLSYVDVMNLGRRATAPALFSVALMDQICPPSTVFAAYHHYGALAPEPPAKRIEVWSHNGHEGGDDYQLALQLDWLRELFSS